MIGAHITNLGKYNEGEPCSDYLKLPATKEDVQTLLSRIGVDGVLYEEIIITDYETDIDGLYRCLGEYESIDELNYLAAMLSDLDEWELEKFEAAVSHGDHNGCLMDLINLTQNLESYEYYPDVKDEDELGHYLIEELQWDEVPERIERYFDYEEYGRDFDINVGGKFTNSGYIYRNDDKFTEHYKGRHIPDDYHIFAYPSSPDKMPIMEQLEMFSKMVSKAVNADNRTKAHDERV
jgi:antirestriction protein